MVVVTGALRPVLATATTIGAAAEVPAISCVAFLVVAAVPTAIALLEVAPPEVLTPKPEVHPDPLQAAHLPAGKPL